MTNTLHRYGNARSFEDDYVVTDKGVEWISRAPREIAELEALMKAGTTGPAPRDRALVERYKVQ